MEGEDFVEKGAVPGAALKSGWEASATKPSSRMSANGGSGGGGGGRDASMSTLLQKLLAPETTADGEDESGGSGSGVLVGSEKAEDVVVLPEGSGFIQLTRSMVVKQLVQRGGTLVTAESGCPSGWAKPQHSSEEKSTTTTPPRFSGVRPKGPFTNDDDDDETDGDDGGWVEFGVGARGALPKRQTKCFAAFRGTFPPISDDHHHARPGSAFARAAKGTAAAWEAAARATHSSQGGPTGAEGSRGLDHDAAGKFCAALSPGAGGRLARIESFRENEVLCVECVFVFERRKSFEIWC
jgi:hypothetical protein